MLQVTFFIFKYRRLPTHRLHTVERHGPVSIDDAEMFINSSTETTLTISNASPGECPLLAQITPEPGYVNSDIGLDILIQFPDKHADHQVLFE